MARSTEDMKKKRQRTGDGDADEIVGKTKGAQHDSELDGKVPAYGKGNHEEGLAKNLQENGKRVADLHFQQLDEQENNTEPLSSNSRKKTKGATEVEDLKSYIQNLGGKLESGWQVTSHRRHGQGKLTKTYISPSNERLRSRVEVAKHLGLSPDSLHKEQSASRQPQMKSTGKAKEDGPSGKLSPNNGPYDAAKNILSVIKTHAEVPSASVANKARAEVPSASIVTDRCQDVLRNIICTESFAALSNMLSGGSASRSMEPKLQTKALPLVAGSLDFKLIHVRLSSGAYGSTPELFFTDIQQVWKDIISAGNEIVSLAHALSENSDNIYSKEILSLFQGADATTRIVSDSKEMPEGVKEPSPAAIQPVKPTVNVQGSSVSLNSHAKKTAHKSKQRAKKSVKSSKPGTLKVSMADGCVSGMCKLCGMQQQDGNSITCSKCTLAFHSQCVDLPPNGLLPGEWYCPSCIREKVPSTKRENDGGERNSDEIRSSGQKKPLVSLNNLSDRVLALSTPDRSIEHAASTGQDPPEVSVEDERPLTSIFVRENVDACKICGAADGKKSIFSCGSCLRCYHLSCFWPRLRKRPHFCPFCICKVCRVHADDDKVLLCESCDQGYHMYCLDPPLPKVPKGDWYCPICMEARNEEQPNSPRQMEVLKRKRKSTEPRRSI